MELSDKLELKFRLDINQKKALGKLKIFSVADLLFHFPVRYSDISVIKKIADLVTGDTATVYGKISKLIYLPAKELVNLVFISNVEDPETIR